MEQQNHILKAVTTVIGRIIIEFCQNVDVIKKNQVFTEPTKLNKERKHHTECYIQANSSFTPELSVCAQLLLSSSTAALMAPP